MSAVMTSDNDRCDSAHSVLRIELFCREMVHALATRATALLSLSWVFDCCQKSCNGTRLPGSYSIRRQHCLSGCLLDQGTAATVKRVNAKTSLVQAVSSDFAFLIALPWLPQRFSLALLSNIHSIIPLLSFFRETMAKLAKNNSDTVTRTAALISLISRLPSEIVSSSALFIQLFHFFLPWGLAQEQGAFFHPGRPECRTARTSPNSAFHEFMSRNASCRSSAQDYLLWPFINTQHRCIR